MSSKINTLAGGCTCGHLRYELKSAPLIVHCCHCRVCQRQTGTAFALNALFIASDVELLQGEVYETIVDSPSGKGQKIARCPKCKVAVWSNYYMGGIKELIRFVRVGALDDPDLLPPDVHIFTKSKQPWFDLPKNALAVDIFYDYEKVWSPENLRRRKEILALVNQSKRISNT